MSKVNIPREMVRNLVEIGTVLEEELKQVTGKNVRMEHHGTKKTVCSIIRSIYDNSESEEIKNLCVEATVLSKKMAARLVEYRKMTNELQGLIDSIRKINNETKDRDSKELQ